MNIVFYFEEVFGILVGVIDGVVPDVFGVLDEVGVVVKVPCGVEIKVW